MGRVTAMTRHILGFYNTRLKRVKMKCGIGKRAFGLLFRETLAYPFERVRVFDAPAEWRCLCIYGDAL
jgi:hypothetical protein